MSDDDDYFTEDICFDDQTLAILDHEEQKFLNQTVKVVPPTKRQKTDNGWAPGIGTASANVPDFYPEISLNIGGSYGVIRGSLDTPGILPRPQSANVVAKQGPVPVPQHLQSNSHHFPSATSHNVQSRDFQHGRPPLQTSNAIRRPMLRDGAVRPASNTHSAFLTPAQSTSSSNRVTLPIDADHGLEIRLQELQQKLGKMHEENKGMQAALNDAMSAKLAREGEVSVLRRNAEKIAQEHAAQLANIKAAREEAEAKQARMQKELREEAERLKTQLIFKQHEQDSALKPPTSVRPKKVFKEASFAIDDTPSRPRYQAQKAQPSGRSLVEKDPFVLTQTRKSPLVKKSSMLPGFQNAFSDVRLLQSPKKRDKIFIEGDTREFSQNGPDLVSPPKHRHRDILVDDQVNADASVDETFMESAHTDADGDIDMLFGSTEDGSLKEEEYMDEILSAMDHPDWKLELNRIVLIHSLPTSNTPTMQLLLGAQLSSNADNKLPDAYMTACSRCLEMIASTVQSEQDWRYTVDCLCQSLISMILPLRVGGSWLALAALLNLLAVLTYSLPDFGASVLKQPCDTGAVNSGILVYMSGIILDQREIEKRDVHEALAVEVVTLLETLSYTIDPELTDRLVYIAQNRQFLISLLRANQLLVRSTRLLVILASHRKLCRFLLSMPDPGLTAAEEEKPGDSQKIPLVERLCLYLTDTSRKDREYKDAKTFILTFFALLSNSHPDVHVHLLASTSVIPSLVFFLAQLTTAFWEDDEDLLSAAPEDVSMAIQTLNQTLFLLHHLVFTSVSFINLRQKLHAPYHRIFNGLMHMFIVTFGRLSYGEAPEWINRQGRIDLVSSTDMARDILDHVVDGPEADRTWQAYQAEGDMTQDPDEEDMEEQLLGECI